MMRHNRVSRPTVRAPSCQSYRVFATTGRNAVGSEIGSRGKKDLLPFPERIGARGAYQTSRVSSRKAKSPPQRVALSVLEILQTLLFSHVFGRRDCRQWNSMENFIQ
jgi:hypothetical protein